MVVEVEEKILQGFAKHPEQGIVEREGTGGGQQGGSLGCGHPFASLLFI